MTRHALFIGFLWVAVIFLTLVSPFAIRAAIRTPDDTTETETQS